MANLANRNAAFQRDVVQYGQLPDLAKAAAALGLSPNDLQSVLGPNVGKLAQENTSAGTSMLARLNADNAKAIQGINNALNARGIYNSGELGYQQGQQNQAYTNSQYDTLQKVLDAMSGAQSSYLSAEQQRIQTLAQALSDAANRAFTNYPGSAGSPPTTANYSYTDTAGNPVYTDSSGNFYDGSGNTYNGPGGKGDPGQSGLGRPVRHGI